MALVSFVWLVCILLSALNACESRLLAGVCTGDTGGKGWWFGGLLALVVCLIEWKLFPAWWMGWPSPRQWLWRLVCLALLSGDAGFGFLDGVAFFGGLGW